MRRPSLLSMRAAPWAMVTAVLLSIVVGPALPAASSTPTWVTTEVGTSLGSGAYAGLDKVSCVSTTFCVAAGTYRDSSLKYQIFASMWNGVTWSDQELAATLNLGNTSDVNGLSCGSPTMCVVTGYYEDGSSVFHPYAALWNGVSWHAQEIAGSLNANGSGDAYQASCVGTNFCAIVGEFADSSSNSHAYVTIWNGTTWIDHALTTSFNPVQSTADAVSCASASYCLAGGDYIDGSAKSHAFVSVWNGGGWSDQEVAGSLNAGGEAIVRTVDCLSTTFCAAGGQYTDASNNRMGFVGLWNGATWSNYGLAAALNVGHDGVVPALSCQSPTSCVAAGTYVDSHGLGQAFASLWDGQNWNDQPLATSLNVGGQASVQQVACMGSAECFVVGSYYDSAHHYQAIQSVWNGLSWTDQPQLTSLNTGGNAQISGISCPTMGFCAEVQYYLDSSSHGHALTSLTMTDQSTLSISPSRTRGFVGHTWAFSVSGGTGSGAVTWSVTGRGCTLVGTTLSASRATTCVVTATKAASGIFNTATSAPATVVVARLHQARLIVASHLHRFVVGTTVTLKTRGGSGSGRVSFHVSGKGCSLKGNHLRDRLATTCVVVAHKASSPVYVAKNSPRVIFTFTAK